MGHLTNPTGFRVGRTLRWPYRWSSDNILFSKYFFLSDCVYQYVAAFFSDFLVKIKRTGFLFSHVRIAFSIFRIFIRVFLYSRDYLKISKSRLYVFLSRARVYFPLRQKQRDLYSYNFLAVPALKHKIIAKSTGYVGKKKYRQFKRKVKGFQTKKNIW